jgi:hypothetical protein
MLVKCEKCGYENFPQHRFCGMCGAGLPSPVGPSVPRPNPQPPLAPKPVIRPSPAPPPSRPSPGALEREPVDPRSVSYLLEDEPAPSHRGRYVLLLVLAVVIAAAGWYWRQDLGPLAARLSGRAAGGSAQPNSAPEPASQSTAEPPAAPGANAGTPVEKPSAAGDQAAAPQAQIPGPSAPDKTTAQDAAQPSQPDQSQPSNQAQSGDSAAKPDDSGEAASQPASAPKAPTRPAAAQATGIDALETEGEKYLYGNGVPENCARARKSLLAAAQHNNAKAQNVLGTMYATGHCATRDLPTAYRWFGRSLQKDPGNTRIEQDLKVLWSQMTPEEQKLALKDTR